MKIIRDQIALDDLSPRRMRFGDLAKAVVDIDRNILAIDAELHADEEAALLDDSSRQAALWGINLYPADFGALNGSSSTPSSHGLGQYQT